jgi:hypothetical protein
VYHRHCSSAMVALLLLAASRTVPQFACLPTHAYTMAALPALTPAAGCPTRCLSSRQPRPYLAPYYCCRQTLDWPPKQSPAGREMHGLVVSPGGRLLVTTGHPSEPEQVRLGWCVSCVLALGQDYCVDGCSMCIATGLLMPYGTRLRCVIELTSAVLLPAFCCRSCHTLTCNCSLLFVAEGAAYSGAAAVWVQPLLFCRLPGPVPAGRTPAAAPGTCSSSSCCSTPSSTTWCCRRRGGVSRAGGCRPQHQAGRKEGWQRAAAWRQSSSSWGRAQ